MEPSACQYIFGTEHTAICFKVHLHAEKITGLQITCLHLIEAFGSRFVVTHGGNPAPGTEFSLQPSW